jgi:hypothetical protein
MPRRSQSAAATALALEAVATVLRSEVHPGGGFLGGDGDARIRWLLRRLRPLARLSPEVRHVVAILNLDCADDTYDNPASYRRQLRSVSLRARRMARCAP